MLPISDPSGPTRSNHIHIHRGPPFLSCFSNLIGFEPRFRCMANSTLQFVVLVLADCEHDLSEKIIACSLSKCTNKQTLPQHYDNAAADNSLPFWVATPINTIPTGHKMLHARKKPNKGSGKGHDTRKQKQCKNKNDEAEISIPACSIACTTSGAFPPTYNQAKCKNCWFPKAAPTCKASNKVCYLHCNMQIKSN